MSKCWSGISDFKAVQLTPGGCYSCLRWRISSCLLDQTDARPEKEESQQYYTDEGLNWSSEDLRFSLNRQTPSLPQFRCRHHWTLQHFVYFKQPHLFYLSTLITGLNGRPHEFNSTCSQQRIKDFPIGWIRIFSASASSSSFHYSEHLQAWLNWAILKVWLWQFVWIQPLHEMENSVFTCNGENQ